MPVELDTEEMSWLSKILSKVTKAKVNKTKQYYENFKDGDMTTLEPIYSAYGEVDGHGDAYKDKEGPYQLTKALLEGKEKGSLQYSLFHTHKTKLFELSDAWVNEEDYDLEDGRVIKAGMPIGVFKHNTEAMYNARVSGRLQGLSIGALGRAELIKDLLSQLKESKTPLRLLSDFIFTHKAAHIAFTSKSQGGAASGHNEHFNIMKSKILDDEQSEVLKDLDEEFSELDKSQITGEEVKAEGKTAPSTSAVVEAQDAGVDNETVNKGQDNMSDAEKQNTELTEALKVIKAMKIEKSLGKYGLDAETVEALSSALAGLEDTSAVLKAMDALVAASDSKVEAIKAEKEELEKSADKTPVEVEMNKELGAADAQDRSEPTEEDIRKANRELAKQEIK